MVYGENPRAGYFQGAQFVHPDMRFVIEFPADWARRKSNKELALINGLAEGASLRAGQTVKRVVGVPVTSNGPRQ
jgi:predicted Zn-dependent protease